MRVRLIYALAALLLPAPAWGQGTGTNPPVGALWTYLGPTYGAGWMPPGGFVPPIVMNDNKSGPVITTGATISAATWTNPSADQILAWGFCTTPCLPLPAQGAGNYDAVRGVGISTPSTTTPIVSGVSGYVLANQAFVGEGPSSVALFGTGVVGVDGGSIWGLNTNVGDRQYRVASTGTHNRRVTGAEIDVSASYPDTNVTGILLAGNSVVQPNNSTAVAVVGQDFSAATPGSIAKWTQAFYTYDGVATHFAVIGQASNTASTDNSQDILWGAKIAGAGYQGQLIFGSGFTAASAVNPSFLFNYPIQTMTGGAIFRSAPNQLVQLGGALDLPSGASIESRNDAGSALQPLEITGQYVMINGPLVLKTFTVAGLTACVPAIANSFAAVSDATSPTYNGTLTGGGGVHVPVFCDGTTWRTH